MKSHAILLDGDSYERYYWNQFMGFKFPNYEVYWSKNIVPLTNRPKDIHFKKSEILIAEGIDPEELCKAQLHYTVFKHLVRTYEIIIKLKFNPEINFEVDLLGEGLYHVCGAQDVAFEFLQRNLTPKVYEIWSINKSSSKERNIGKNARMKWMKDNDYPLQSIRDYRNHLTHGLMIPTIGHDENRIKAPKITKENDYQDWRLITDGYSTKTILTDFEYLDLILEEAWEKTIEYFNNEWEKIKYIQHDIEV